MYELAIIIIIKLWFNFKNGGLRFDFQKSMAKQFIELLSVKAVSQQLLEIDLGHIHSFS